MDTSNFTLNYKGVGELMRQDSMRAHLERQAKAVEDMAKDIAPVKTGEYRDSIESGTFDDGDRFTGYVAATVPYALAVEIKDSVLTRALDAVYIIP